MKARFVLWSMAWVAAAGAWTTVSAAELGRSAPPVVNNTRVTGGGSNPAVGLQLAFFAPLQIFPSTYDVSGFRFNLVYGRNASVRGLDLGIVNDATGNVEGFQLGIGNRAGDLAGLQIGAYNAAGSSEFGCCQLGFVNLDGDTRGFMLGAVNMAHEMNGVQIGLFNYCETMAGVQIGLLNFITQSDFLIFCPIVNARF